MSEVCGREAELSRCPNAYLRGRCLFSAGTHGDASALAPAALLDADEPIPGEHTLPFPGSQDCMVGSLQPILPSQEQSLLTGEACGCSICHFCEFISSVGDAPQYPSVLSGTNLAIFAPFVCSEA